MPSSTQTITGTLVYDYEIDPMTRAGRPGLQVACSIENAKVAQNVNFAAGQQTTTTDANGYWQFTVAVSQTYVVRVPGRPTRRFAAPATNTTTQVSTILV